MVDLAQAEGEWKVYTRASVDASWTERTHLRLPDGAVVERTAGDVSVVPIVQTYAPGPGWAPYVDYTHHWCRITYTPDGGSETDLWYGHLSDQTLDEAAGEIRWTALSIEAEIDRLRFDLGFADPVVAGNCESLTLPVFNDSLEEDALRGLRGTTEYHFSRDGTYRTPATGGTEYDRSYAFGTGGAWDAWELLRALFAWHAPAGGGRNSRIGFYPVATPAAKSALQDVTERWDTLGKSGRRVLDAVCDAAGDLAWSLDWSPDGTFGYAFVRVRLWSRRYGDRDASTQALHDVDAGGVQPITCNPSHVSISVRDRVTDVVVLGARARVQFTVAYDSAEDHVRPTYERGWTDTDESNWEAAKEDPGPQYDHVFRRFRLPWDQTDGGESTWQVFARPSSEYYSTRGDYLDTDLCDGNFYAHPRRLLPRLLTRVGWTYTGQGGGSPLAISTGGIDGVPEHHRILAWYEPEDGEQRDRVVPLQGVQPLDEEPGLEVPAQYRTPHADVDLSSSPAGTPAWQKLYFTVAIETDNRLTACASAFYYLGDGETSDEQRRLLVLEVPEAHWWALMPDTYLSGSGGNFVEANSAGGVLRNDLPVLQTIADSVLARYSHRSTHADLPLVQIDTDKSLGDFIGAYGPHTLQCPVLTLRHHVDLGPIGTEVLTGRPWSGRHV